MREELDTQLNGIPDWNCCAAFIGWAGGGELPRPTLSARSAAVSRQHRSGDRRHLRRLLACQPSGRSAPPGRRPQRCVPVGSLAALAKHLPAVL